MKTFIIIIFSIFNFNLYSQSSSLWTDSNPYSTGTQGLQVGAIIRVILKDGIKAEYVYESGKDETITIKSSPDKKSIPEIMGYNMDRTIAGKKNGKEKSNSKIVGAMAAQVIGLDPAGNLIITGSREATYDTGKSSLKLTGKVAGGDIKDGNAIESDKVAELKLEYIASPIEKTLKDPDLQLKPALDPKGKPIIGPDGQPVLKSEITETERQKIILKNIKRLLGESE